MSHASSPILIIGAGMAGLACANWLHRAGRPVLLLEAADAVGGRVRTDATADGFRLDRGFQILLSDYPEARRMFDYGALRLQAYRSGAVVQLPDGHSTTLENPLQAPAAALSALASPIGTLADKLLLAKLGLELRGDPTSQLHQPATSTTLEFLRSYGFSEQLIRNFLQPFFGGVYLDRTLSTASNFFRFLFPLFATSDAAVPAAGIGALGEQLAARLPAGVVRLNAPVAAVLDAGRRVRLASGELLAAATTVLATDGLTAARLLGITDEQLAPTHPVAHATTCTYFAAAGAAPGGGQRLLHLNARPGALAHNVAFPSEISPEVAPAGQHLISVSTHGAHGLPEPELTGRLRQELAGWFGPAAGTWRHLRTYFIEQALPAYLPGQPVQQRLRLDDDLWRCGDWVSYPSLNGALATGRQVAEQLLASQS